MGQWLGWWLGWWVGGWVTRLGDKITGWSMNLFSQRQQNKANKVRRVDRRTNALSNRPTDRPTDTASYGGALSHLKNWSIQLVTVIGTLCKTRPVFVHVGRSCM